MTNTRKTRGFTLVEVLVATFLSALLAAALLTLFKNASDASQTGTLRADVQQAARGSLAIINRDLSQASIGIPQSGIPLPSGAGSTGLSMFACDSTQCYLAAGNNTYPNNTLSPVTPGENKGPGATDVITIAYLDPTWPVNNQNLTAMAPDGSTITVDTGTFDASGNPAAAPAGKDYQDAVVGTKVGDVLLVQNQAGPAVATVTKVGAAGVIELRAGDPLNLNQTTAAAGNLASIYNPLVTTSAARINVVTYFIQMQPGPDGVLGTADDVPVLMRQSGAHKAIPLAEYTQNMQFLYDVFDASTGANGTYTAGLLGSGVTNASQIRKVGISLTLRSEFRTPQGSYHTLTVSSAVSPRDLSFTDRYK
jgi:prepilin-type N-terminal cleavage/methylation domain-containing protein